MCVSEAESSKICAEVRSSKSGFPPTGSAQGVFITSKDQTAFSGAWPAETQAKVFNSPPLTGRVTFLVCNIMTRGGGLSKGYFAILF